MLKPDSLATRILRWFVGHPGLHNAVTINELGRQLDLKFGTAAYQRMNCDLIHREGVDIRSITTARDGENRIAYWLPTGSVEAAKKILSAAALANSKTTSQPSTTAAPDVPPPASGAHSRDIATHPVYCCDACAAYADSWEATFI